VLISSSNEADQAFAAQLLADLQVQGIVTWSPRAVRHLDTSQKRNLLQQAIRSTQLTIVIASPSARTSRDVRNALKIVKSYRKALCIIWISGDLLQNCMPSESHEPIAKIDARIEPRQACNVLEVALHEEDTQNLARLLAVLGPSGSGKSSLVMAGVLRHLQRGAITGSERWIYLEPVVPGPDPLKSLAQVLLAHLPGREMATILEDLEDESTRGLHILTSSFEKSPGAGVVLVVDQCENLFSPTVVEAERQAFIDLLVTAATEPDGAVTVIVTLRADFLDRLLHSPQLGPLIRKHLYLVLPMSMNDLRATIEGPARLQDVQLTFEGNLVGDLLFETYGQPGTLPLLEFTLDQLFERRRDHMLTLSAYYEIGGVKGALARHAEKTYAELPSKEHRGLARSLFLRLIDQGTTEQDVTRRRASFSEFTHPDQITTRWLNETADAFIAAHLLTTNKVAGITTIELSHEAVIHEWKRLADWIREAHEELRLLRAIREDASEWRRYGQSADWLYRGTQLAEARALREHSLLNSEEETFLDASVREQVRQKALLTRQYRRTVIVGLAGLAVTAAVSGLLIFRNEPSPSFPLQNQTLPTKSVAWSPDGKQLASASADQTVQVWEAISGHTLFTY
jgi:hypothetical protein